jgi:hypothetical protein
MNRLCLVLMVCAACGGKKDDASDQAKPADPPKQVDKAPRPPPPPKPTQAEQPAQGSNQTGPNTPMVGDAPEGNPPPDGTYNNVMVEGVTIPVVKVMEGGTVVLIDTDGKKPRTWEEQYKKKNAKKKGQLDEHKTDKNHNNKFDDDQVDKTGLWLIDVKGNITKR